MKKTICILTLICMLLSCFAVTASAETVQPLMPDILRELLAGKTFIAQMDGYSSDEAMEHVTLFWQICEQEEYTAEEVEALAVGDTILVGGDSFEIKETSQGRGQVYHRHGYRKPLLCHRRQHRGACSCRSAVCGLERSRGRDAH